MRARCICVKFRVSRSAGMSTAGRIDALHAWVVTLSYNFDVFVAEWGLLELLHGRRRYSSSGGFAAFHGPRYLLVESV
jgi:hypothetical protein